MNNNNNNMDMAQLMNMLAKMDKKEIEKGLSQVSQMLKNGNFNSKNENDKKYEMYRHMLDHLDFWDAEKRLLLSLGHQKGTAS